MKSAHAIEKSLRTLLACNAVLRVSFDLGFAVQHRAAGGFGHSHTCFGIEREPAGRFAGAAWIGTRNFVKASRSSRLMRYTET